MRAAIYLRISLDRDGRQLAVSRQREDCLKLCQAKGWTPVEYLDNSVSATSRKPRPAYQRMLADIADGQLGAVVVWDLDRLHRQPRELEDFIDLADAHRLELATVTGDTDLSTDNGRLFARIKGAVGKSETERKAARQRRAARQLAESGAPKWRRAFGYLETPTGPVPDPKVAPLVAEAYAAVLAGGSISDVARTWNAAGALTLTGKLWNAAQVSNFLRKPRNAGLRTYRADQHRATRDDVIGPGTWAPLVDPELFWAVQTAVDAPERRPGRKSVSKHLLTGVLSCGKCGGPMRGQWVRQATGGKPGRPKAGETKPPKTQVAHSIAYACRTAGCFGASVRAEHIEPIVRALVVGTLAAPDAVDLLKAERHDAAEAESLRVEAATLHARSDQLAADYAEGLLTAKQVRTATDIIEAKLTAIAARQHDSERLRVFDGIPLGTAEVAAAVDALSPDRLRAVIDVLMTVTIMPVGKVGKGFRPERVKVEWR